MAETIFTAQFKRRTRVQAGVILFAAGIIPFAAGLVVITYLLPSTAHLAAGAVTAGAFVLGIVLPWLSQEHLALLGNGTLRQRLAAKVRSPGQEAMEFVGFSPGETIRMWEGETDRDVGYLEMSAGVLVYRGDAFAWSLRRESIDSVQPLEIPVAVRRIVVAWHTPGQPKRLFTLASREARTLRGCNRATGVLYKRLQDWFATTPPSGEIPTLGPPPTSIANSIPLEKVPTGSCLSILAITVLGLLGVWYAAERFISEGFYCHAILWSGLIAVGTMIFASYFLSYLQVAEARESARHPNRR